MPTLRRTSLGVAIPGPFDHRRWIVLFKDVGKFDALLDVNLTARLHAVLPHLTGDITFVNDADAFAVGEWRQGVTAAATRCVGITLGSGVGSSFLENGIPVTAGPTVPPHGRAHRLKIGTADLEDVVSRRAILARYLAGPNVTSTTGLDVHDVFDRSRAGDAWATQVLEDAFRALGGALAPWFTRFQATTVAFGGAMTGSWDLVLPPLRSGLTTAGARIDIELLPSADTERSALVGAATYAHPVKVCPPNASRRPPLPLVRRSQLASQCFQLLVAFGSRLGVGHFKVREGVEDDLGDDESGVLFVVGGHYVPGRAIGAGRVQAGLVGLHVLVPVGPLMDVREAELPVFVGRVNSSAETVCLLGL